MRRVKALIEALLQEYDPRHDYKKKDALGKAAMSRVGKAVRTGKTKDKNKLKSNQYRYDKARLASKLRGDQLGNK